MPLPVVVIISSERCIHCITTRPADGQPRNANTPAIPTADTTETKLWSQGVFNALLRGLPSPSLETSEPVCARVFEIVFADVQGSEVRSVGEFTYEAERKVVRREAKASSLPPPSAFIPYIARYPAWVFVRGSDWDEAVAKRPGADVPGSLRAFVFGGLTRRTGYGKCGQSLYTVYYLDPPSPSLRLTKSFSEFVASPVESAAFCVLPAPSTIVSASETTPEVQAWRRGGFGTARIVPPEADMQTHADV